MSKILGPRGPHTGVMHTGFDTEADETTIGPVARWEQILTVLQEAGEIPVQTELQIHKQAWRLARSEGQLTRLRALADRYGQR